MAETNTFSDNAVRQIAELVFEEKRRSLMRSMTSVRRHEGVIMPSAPLKIVTPTQTLYAAFGGGDPTNANIDYGNADSNALAISTGNYIPLTSGSTATARNRQFYPRNCTVWELDSNNVLQATDEVIQAYNPGSLPIPSYTYCYAAPIEGSTNYMIVGRVMPHAADTRHFRMILGTPLEVAGDNYESKFVRNESWTSRPYSSSSATTDWAHAVGPDIYIHHPGTYEITYGVEVERGSNDSADMTTYTDSNSDTIDLPSTRDVKCDLALNWMGGGGTLADNWNSTNSQVICVTLPPGSDEPITAERTFMVNHTLDTPHGYPYLRLSLAIGKCGAQDPAGTAKLTSGWVSIRAAGSCVAGGNQGSGYNVFLGTSGAFNWHGGGTAPAGADFGEDGT